MKALEAMLQSAPSAATGNECRQGTVSPNSFEFTKWSQTVQEQGEEKLFKN